MKLTEKGSHISLTFSTFKSWFARFLTLLNQYTPRKTVIANFK